MKYESSGWSIVITQQIAVTFTILIMTFAWDIVLVFKLNADSGSLRILSEGPIFFWSLSSTLDQELITVSWVWSFLPEIGKQCKKKEFLLRVGPLVGIGNILQQNRAVLLKELTDMRIQDFHAVGYD